MSGPAGGLASSLVAVGMSGSGAAVYGLLLRRLLGSVGLWPERLHFARSAVG